jgi:hypothetical protein
MMLAAAADKPRSSLRYGIELLLQLTDCQLYSVELGGFVDQRLVIVDQGHRLKALEFVSKFLDEHSD